MLPPGTIDCFAMAEDQITQGATPGTEQTTPPLFHDSTAPAVTSVPTDTTIFTATPLAPAPPLANQLLPTPDAKANSVDIGSLPPFFQLQKAQKAPMPMHLPRPLVGANTVLKIAANPHSFTRQNQATSTAGRQETVGEREQQQGQICTAMSDCSGRSPMIHRAGKWTTEEEAYANILIELFEEGRVQDFEEYDHPTSPHTIKIKNGMTMRHFLSRKLCCSPMRISKKFAGRGIGKLVYTTQRKNVVVTSQEKQQLLLLRQVPGFLPTSVANAVVPLPRALFLDRLNRLKQAEEDFFKVAFLHGNPVERVGSKFVAR